jgi:hypothetical protein
MSTLFAEQQALQAHQFSIPARLEQGIAYSMQRLPATLGLQDLQQPAIAERIAALNDRFTKLQDQRAGALRRAHAMLGERYRSVADVVAWAVRVNIPPDTAAWLELCALRNRLTHDYDLEAESALELIALIRSSVEVLSGIIRRFEASCRESGLLPASP